MRDKLIIVTGNAYKYKELETYLKEFFDCEQGIVPDAYEIQGTPEKILAHKVKQAYEYFQKPVLVDDVSFHLAELNGFPGQYARDFWDAMPAVEVSRRFAGTKAHAVCRLALMKDNDTLIVGEGSVHGTVVPAPVDLFEFDCFLVPEGRDKVMAESSPEEKNTYSHRGNALRDLISKLRK